MFRASDKKFIVNFYLSSLLFPYLILLIYILISILQDNKYKLSLNIIMKSISTELKVAILVIFIAILYFAFCLKLIHGWIKDLNNYSSSLRPQKIYVESKYNEGFRDFIMSVLIPIISTFSITEHPISTLFFLFSLQLIIYFFYKNSSDIFPNISLTIFGYSVFSGINKNKKCYVFGRTKNIHKIVNSYQKAFFVGDPAYKNKNTMVIVEKEKINAKDN